MFAEADVETFAAGRRRSPEPAAGAPPIHTGITLISGGKLHYRGQEARELARTVPFEAVAGLLWTGELIPMVLTPDPALCELAEQVIAPLPPSARLTDRLRLIVAAAAAADPLRFDTTPPGVVATARTLLGTMVAALPPRNEDAAPVDGATLAALLWSRLTDARPTPAGLSALNAALVLLADHDLAASTLAARVAASTRAHPYAVVSAGLAVLDGPLHGAASGLAHRMLTDAMNSGDPLATVSERLRTGDTVPGFGHHLYSDGDPRAVTLLELIDDVPPILTELASTLTSRSGIAPNIDFAIAVLALRYDMPPGAGEAIFAIARTAGWIAHALEEYADRPSRFRPSGRYAGRPPTAPR
jgi:citrate synthase